MPRIAHCLLAGLALAIICPPVLSQERPGKGQYGPGEFRNTREIGTSTVEDVLRIQGARAQIVTGPQAGYSFEAMPGVKRVTAEELATMKEIPQSGLFIVDGDYIPVPLFEDLKRAGYRLQPDGSLLDRAGKPATMFVGAETFQLFPQSLGPDPGFFDRPAAPSGDERSDPKQHGSLMSPMPGIPEPPIWVQLDQALRSVGNPFISTAQAASPFPFSCFSWYWKWKYDGGFCRGYEAWTDAYAWGPGVSGNCAGPLPHTNIEYVRAYARAVSDVGDQYCYNCDQRHAYADYSFGCFWPAHGSSDGYHFVHLGDGSIQVVRSKHWFH
jgi:hypothetical protein